MPHTRHFQTVKRSMTSPAQSESKGRSPKDAIRKTWMQQTTKKKETIGEDPTISTDVHFRLIADNTHTLVNERGKLNRRIVADDLRRVGVFKEPTSP